MPDLEDFGEVEAGCIAVEAPLPVGDVPDGIEQARVIVLADWKATRRNYLLSE